MCVSALFYASLAKNRASPCRTALSVGYHDAAVTHSLRRSKRRATRVATRVSVAQWTSARHTVTLRDSQGLGYITC